MSNEQTNVFNANCNCSTLNTDKLERLQKEMAGSIDPNGFDFSQYFSSSPTSISKTSLGKIESFLQSFGRVIGNKKIFEFLLRDLDPRYKKRIPKKVSGGLFLGFDFHDTEEGPKLIEINTNAGGLLINSILYEVQDPCCRLLYCKKEMSDFTKWKEQIYNYFLQEWNLYFPEKEWQTIAILDEDPKSQFLYPEFKIFQNIFHEQGKKAFICAPDDLQWKENGLYYLDDKIDFIYNRHTDFLLKKPEMQNVAMAWESEKIALSPNPIDYLLFANKANLEIFSDAEFLRNQGLEDQDVRLLTDVIPKTYRMCESNKEADWGNRKNIFFKPQNSFGSKGVYAGRKISKTKFEEIIKLDYLAQEEIPPSVRTINSLKYKIDYRAYVYDFNMLMLASRLYQGQTTNFRTEGGGFSPVMEIG